MVYRPSLHSPGTRDWTMGPWLLSCPMVQVHPESQLGLHRSPRYTGDPRDLGASPRRAGGDNWSDAGPGSWLGSGHQQDQPTLHVELGIRRKSLTRGHLLASLEPAWLSWRSLRAKEAKVSQTYHTSKTGRVHVNLVTT